MRMIGGVIGPVLTAVIRRPATLRLAFSMISEARRSAVPFASVTMPATASRAGSPRGPPSESVSVNVYALKSALSPRPSPDAYPNSSDDRIEASA